MPPRPDDQSLLDRLNALKPTGVSLEQPANTTILPGRTDTQSVSREDALAARLRSLRRQPSNTGSRDEDDSHGDGDGHSQPPGRVDHAGAGTAAPPSAAAPALGDRPSDEKVNRQASSASPEISRISNQKRPSYRFLDSEADDDDAVDELLEALGDEVFDLAAEDDAEPPPDFDPSDEATKVTRLLESLQKSSRGHASREGNNPAEGDDDDSDGEQMTRAVETLLSQLGDEINSLPPPGAEAPKTNGPGKRKETALDSDIKPVKGVTDDGNSPFTLPTVPSKLVDPVPDTNPEDDFEADISARLASLRGLGPLDALGLPSAPTFRPESHNPTFTSGRGLLKSNKYTDEDQKTWCVVCLEDANIRCVGCDNDVYCARCWKEMHVGPSAGYDERGHQWVKFERTIQP